jgi:hypothetical protein
MGIRTWLKTHRTIASATVLAMLIAGPVTLAVLHQGFPQNDVELDVRDVWVTNGTLALTGRLNMQIRELNGAVSMASNDFDVMQDGQNVFTYDEARHTVERIDPAFVTRGQKIDVPAGATVAYGGNRIAIMSRDGQLWIVDAQAQLQFSIDDTPVADLGADALVAVGLDGTVWAVSTESQELVMVAAGTFVVQKRADVSVGSDALLSAVGGRAAILDPEMNALVLDDGRVVPLGDHEALRIQQPGPERPEVVVATADAIVRVGFDGSIAAVGNERSSDSDASERVAAPVVVGPCIYAAWSSTATFLGVCDDRGNTITDIPSIDAESRVEFRVNRTVVALNDVVTGRLWVPGETMVPVDRWETVTPPPPDESEETNEESAVQTFEDTLAERKEENTPPVAHDDRFGVRPGNTTILPVLDNDSDPDGDVLTINNLAEVPATQGRIEVIDNGRALQFVPADGVTSGSVDVRYSVTDGRPGGIAEAVASIEVHPTTQNGGPASTRVSAIAVEAGATTSRNVLIDWLDPDGDALTLVGATSLTGDTVRYTPDGLVTFTATSAELGDKMVTVSVTDGTTTTAGEFLVQVEAAGSLDPVGTPDYISGFAGDRLEIKPLHNDQSPSGEQLELTGVEALTAGVTPVADYDSGLVRVSVGTPGTYYLQYTLAAGASDTIGIIRVDVLPDPESALAPIAVKDTVYVRPKEPTVVSALINDVSPLGNVLAIQSIQQPVGALASVEILSSTQLRVTAPSAMTQTETVTYTISDGSVIDGQPVTSTAEVTIVPVPELVKHQAPIANDDSIKVRAGDVATISVLNNDYHPDGVRMQLDPELIESTFPGGDGLTFVAGDQVRIQAPEQPAIYAVTYRVTDAYNEASTAKVIVEVTERDPDTNAPPTPAQITARVFQDAAITIDVPLDGVDPDGDSVVFTSATGALLGEIPVSGVTSTSFVYQAAPDRSGTDVFTYEVRDTFGLAATGEVRVAVIPRGDTVMSPTAVPDAVSIRPGRVAAVPVLANDSDPNGYEITVLPEPLADKGLDVELDENFNIVVTAGEKVGTYAVAYQLDNGHSPPVPGTLLVSVDPDAPIQPPTAIDHVIESSEVVGEREFVVDALSGAVNPGGPVEDLEVTLDGPNADIGVVNADGTVTVTLGDARQAVAYRLTNNEDDLSAMAFIVVPKYSDAQPPYLRTDLTEEFLNVPRNTKKEFSLADVLVIPSGRPAVLINTEALSAGRGVVTAVDDDTFAFTPEQDYFGDTIITFTVTDGADGDDPNGNTAVISMKVTVGDPNGRDIAPSFADAVFEIEPGEAPDSFDLRAATTHPNPDVIQEIQYTNFAVAADQISATIDGGQLVASAAPGATGATAVATFDLQFEGFTVPARVAIVVVASKRPLAQTVDDAEPEGRSNSTYTISPLANDVNPFADLGEPLRIVDAQFNGDSIGAGLTFTDSTVTVITGPTKSGTISVIYTVEDSTGAAERRVPGRITVTVRSAPEPVQSPSVERGGSETIVVTFQPPVSSNGAEITGYTVRVSGAPGPVERTDCVPGGSCVITGRTNGQLQTVVVDATNAVGTTSSSSVTVIPYGIPTAPTNPTYTTNSSTANASITPQWAVPGDQGGGAITYTWALNDGQTGSTPGFTGGSRSVGAGDYSFTVVACNPAGCSPASGNSVHINPPPPSIAMSKGGATGIISGCSGGGCSYFHVEARNFAANQTFSATCQSNDGSGWVGIGSTSVRSNGQPLAFDGAGNFSGDIGCWDGFGNINRVIINGVTSSESDF